MISHNLSAATCETDIAGSITVGVAGAITTGVVSRNTV